MKRDEFVQKLGTYWSRTPIEVLDEIRSAVWAASDAARSDIMQQMKRTVPPARIVGVSDIYDAANATGSALTRYAAHEFDVRCACCQGGFSYQQGVRDECPACGFPHIRTIDLRGYEANGKVPGSVQAAYDWLIDRHYGPFHRRREAAQ